MNVLTIDDQTFLEAPGSSFHMFYTWNKHGFIKQRQWYKSALTCV